MVIGVRAHGEFYRYQSIRPSKQFTLASRREKRLHCSPVLRKEMG